MPGVFSFREFDVPDPLSVELSADDAPYARLQTDPAFEMGGELNRKKVKLPGRVEPLYHVFQADHDPLTIKGAFRDYRMGAGHARNMRQRIERIRSNGNLLRITWGSDQWTGLLDKALFGVEGEGHLQYELRFDIGLSPDHGATPAAAPPRGTADQLQAVLARLRARPPSPPGRGFLASLNAGMKAMENALALLADGQRALEVAVGDVAGQARRVTSLGAQVQQLAAQGAALLKSVEREAKAQAASVDALGRSQTYTSILFSLQRDSAYVARDAAQAARARIVSTTKLYVVKTGDTLESIARGQMGDAGRASELGATTPAPGALLRIPGPR